LFVGPLSDAFGRKRVILFGALFFAVSAVICFAAPSLETLLIARVLQGLGASAARVVSVAMVRDQFSGRAMARVMSFVMMVFMLVPAVAPLMGQAVMAVAGWRDIFLVYVAFAGLSALWLWLRQPETLPVAQRKPLSITALRRAVAEVFSHRIVLISIAAQTLTLGMLFATLSSMQGIFEVRFARAETFPYWFALIALGSGAASAVNAKVVMRLGMRRVVNATYLAMFALTVAILAANLSGAMPEPVIFGLHVMWTMALFATLSLTMGNLNALAMEPLGHIAGMASSAITSVSTVGSVLLAVPVGQSFDGTAIPLMIGVAIYGLLALLLVRYGAPERAPA
jgi:MFS transporter, DHA1 family, multidrug resistance protein